MDFKIGDTVQVKSGGPLLTVLETSGDNVTCLFFSEELGTFQRDTFPAIVIEEVEIVDDESDDAPHAKKASAHHEDDEEDNFDDEDADDEEDDEKSSHKAA